MQALGPYTSRRATPRRARLHAWALLTLSAVLAEFLPRTLSSPHRLSLSSQALARVERLTAVQCNPDQIPPPKSRTTHGKTGGTGDPGIRGTDARLRRGAQGAASYQEMQLPLVR